MGNEFLKLTPCRDKPNIRAMPTAGKFALWKHKAIYLQGDGCVGQWSDVVHPVKSAIEY